MNTRIERLREIKERLKDKETYVDTGMFRLHHVDCIDKKKLNGNIKHCMKDTIYDNYIFQDDFTQEETYKIISFLIDRKKEELHEEEISPKVLGEVNYMMPGFGFIKVPNLLIFRPIDLYVLKGNIDTFKNSKESYYYFDWYKDNCTPEEISKILEGTGTEEKFNKILKLKK